MSNINEKTPSVGNSFVENYADCHYLFWTSYIKLSDDFTTFLGMKMGLTIRFSSQRGKGSSSEVQVFSKVTEIGTVYLNLTSCIPYRTRKIDGRSKAAGVLYVVFVSKNITHIVAIRLEVDNFPLIVINIRNDIHNNFKNALRIYYFWKNEFLITIN